MAESWRGLRKRLQKPVARGWSPLEQWKRHKAPHCWDLLSVLKIFGDLSDVFFEKTFRFFGDLWSFAEVIASLGEASGLDLLHAFLFQRACAWWKKLATQGTQEQETMWKLMPFESFWCLLQLWTAFVVCFLSFACSPTALEADLEAKSPMTRKTLMRVCHLHAVWTDVEINLTDLWLIYRI